MKEKISYNGKYIIYNRKIYREKGIIKNKSKWKKIDEVENIITDWTINTLALSLMGQNPIDAGVRIKHCAIGTDNTAATASDETLGTEVFRVPYAAYRNSSNGTVVHDFYIGDTEYVGDIEEIGIFAGDYSFDWNVGAGKDTGELISRALWDYTKNGSEQLVIQRIDQLSRA